MSHLTQMIGLAVQNFVSAAVGPVGWWRLIRGLVRRRSNTLGNFWVDSPRNRLTGILLPFSFLLRSCLCVRQWSRISRPLQTRSHDHRGSKQTIPGGPIASQEAIKELGNERAVGPYNAINLRTRSRTRTRSPTSSRSGRCWRSRSRSPTRSGSGGNVKQGLAVLSGDVRPVAPRRLDGSRWSSRPTAIRISPLPAPKIQSNDGNPTRRGTWRAKRPGSGPATSGLFRRVDDRHRRERSTRCTTASRPSAARRRSSTSCSARSTPAVPARASTACWCSRSWRCSSRASWSGERRSISARRSRAPR